MTAPANQHEVARLEALEQYGILDTPSETVFDELAQLAASICETPIGLITLVDAHRQWFKASLGLEFRETHRSISFCTHAILQNDIFEVPDALKDSRFESNPLVLSEPNFRFYAGAPLIMAGNAAIGTLSVIDHVPRRLTGPQRTALRILGRQVVGQLELRKQALEPETRLRREVETSREALGDSERRYRSLFERNLAGVYRSTIDGDLLECNQAFARILGYESPADIAAHPTWDLYFSSLDRSRAIGLLTESGELVNFEMRLRRKDGEAVWVIENETLRRDLSPPQIEGIIVDITARKIAEERVEHQAYYDFLTDLPNRLLFNDRLELALAHARRSGNKLAVMFLDLDHFKLINDTMAHSAGDALLRTVAARMQGALRQDDTVARMGGDEFTLLLPDVNSEDDAVRIAIKILDLFHEPHVIHGREVFVTGSMGIALFPNDGSDAETLVKNADDAMYRAKDLGRDNFQFYTPMAQQRAHERLVIETDLRRALDRNQFFLEYQPQISLMSGEIVGVEALVRWRHPERGVVMPGSFISLAEEIGAILPIGEWVLRTACEQAADWSKGGIAPIRMAVNVSARQFASPGLRLLVERVLEETGLDPARLDLEITESVAMRDAEYTLSLLGEFRRLGIRLSIDDFGTGYSSLGYLRLFPIHALKIDRAFVNEISASARDRSIVDAVIRMSHSLGLATVAEGVEFEDQRRILMELGCDDMQGYLVSPAVLPEALAGLLPRA